MYRLIVESLLGLRLTAGPQGPVLHFVPCLPADWPGFTLHYRYRETTYRVVVCRDPLSGAAVSVDGIPQPDLTIPLVDDRRDHQVDVNLPQPTGRY
jgi:cellobiose phosphorylase